MFILAGAESSLKICMLRLYSLKILSEYGPVAAE